jgi:hypothetical protein
VKQEEMAGNIFISPFLGDDYDLSTLGVNGSSAFTASLKTSTRNRLGLAALVVFLALILLVMVRNNWFGIIGLAAAENWKNRAPKKISERTLMIPD